MKVIQIRNNQGLWLNCYAETGERIGNQHYKTKKDAKKGHFSGDSTGCSWGSDGYESAARQYAE